MKFVENLEFFHFNTNEPGEYLHHCESAFALWEEQWSETFKELNVDKKLYNDDFLNRELGGLFLGSRAVGFILYHFLDFSRYSNFNVSYSRNYPENLWRAHYERRDRVMVASHLTLDPEWRKNKTNLPASEILFSLAVLRFLKSPADRLITYARNNRKMNEMVYRHGGEAVLKNHTAYNVSVDFIEIPKTCAQISALPDCAPITLNLWTKTKQTEEYDVYRLRKQKNGTPYGLHELSPLGELGIL